MPNPESPILSTSGLFFPLFDGINRLRDVVRGRARLPKRMRLDPNKAIVSGKESVKEKVSRVWRTPSRCCPPCFPPLMPGCMMQVYHLKMLQAEEVRVATADKRCMSLVNIFRAVEESCRKREDNRHFRRKPFDE